jgi:putative tricarboxylic transport membrane protein
MSVDTPSEREPVAPGSADTGTEAPGVASTTLGPLVTGGLLLVVGVVLLTQAVRVGMENGVTLGGPTLAPIIVTGLWVLVALAFLMGRLRDRAMIVPATTWRTPAFLLVALIVYAVVLKYTVVGYVLSTVAFVLVAARLMSTRPLREVIVRDLLTAVGLSVGIYLVFTRLLGIVLPAGVLPV